MSLWNWCYKNRGGVSMTGGLGITSVGVLGRVTVNARNARRGESETEKPMSDKLTEAIIGALDSWWGSERVYAPFVAHLAGAVRAAGQTHVEHLGTRTRRVLTLTGEWETTEVPAAEENTDG